MSSSAYTSGRASTIEHLPVWWRCVLIALATIILCSCSSPMTRTAMGAERTALSADKSLDAKAQGSSAEGAAVVIQDNSVELPADESLRCDQSQRSEERRVGK